MIIWDFLTIVGTLQIVVAQITGQQIADDLKLRLSSNAGIILRDNANYSQAVTPRWDTYISATYLIAIQPKTIHDVQEVVKYASQNNVPFLTIGGGHGLIQTISDMKNGISLDLANFKNIQVDAEANTVTIGGAVRSRELTPVLQTKGKEMPIGSCPCIGMLGFTLGGGIGPYVGMYGVASDQLLSVDMVTGKGEVLHVSKSKNSDLFWGMKGAGANLGIVTSATYKVYNTTNNGNTTNIDMIFPAAASAPLWEAFTEIVAEQPKELYLSAAMAYNATTKLSFIIVNALYAGPEDAATNSVKSLLDLNPLNPVISSVLWKDIGYAVNYGLVGQGCQPQSEIDFGVNLPHLDASALKNMTSFIIQAHESNPAAQQSLITLTVPGTYGRSLSSRSSSAFAWRHTTAFLQIQAGGASSENARSLYDYGVSVREEAQRAFNLKSLRTYVHFAYGDEGNEAWYSPGSLPRLRSLKARYDPQNLFRYYGGIET